MKVNWKKLETNVKASIEWALDIVDDYFGDISQMRKDVKNGEKSEEEHEEDKTLKIETYKILIDKLFDIDVDDSKE